MRFAPQFPNLPATVPSKIYVKAKKRKVVTVPATPNEQQMDAIKKVVKMLPPAMLFDPVIFPANSSLLHSMALLSEASDMVNFFNAPFFAYKTDGCCYLQETGSGRVVCQGTTGELFSYAMRRAPSALKAVLRSVKIGIVHPEQGIDIAETLDRFRAERRFSESLNKISKLDELKYVDQDSTMFKFLLEPDEPVNDKAIHLGSGKPGASSIRALKLSYDRVVCVDPLAPSGGDWHSAVCDLQKIQPGWDVFSDVAIGDGKGMTLQHQKKYLEGLYSLAGPNRLVVAKIGLMKGVCARGFVRYKPRPHNIEVIVELDPDGAPLDEIYDQLAPDVHKANVKRNNRMFHHDFVGELKRTKLSPLLMRDLMRQKIVTPLPGHLRRRQLSRNVMLVQGGAAKRSKYRAIAWNDRCRSARPAAPRCAILPPDVLPTRRYVRHLDPGFPDLEFSFATVVASLKDRGLEVAYIGNEWGIVE